jgi:hypothetical protein
MNNSKNTSSLASLVANARKRIEFFFKSCFPKNKIYAEASTQTENQNQNCQFEVSGYYYVSMQHHEAMQPINKFDDDPQFNKAIESYYLLNSSNHIPLILTNGSMFQPIYAEGKLPSNIDRPSALLEKPILQARITRKISL